MTFKTKRHTIEFVHINLPPSSLILFGVGEKTPNHVKMYFKWPQQHVPKRVWQLRIVEKLRRGGDSRGTPWSIWRWHWKRWSWFQRENGRYMTAACSEPVETNASGGLDGACLVEASFWPPSPFFSAPDNTLFVRPLPHTTLHNFLSVFLCEHFNQISPFFSS